MKDIKDSMKRAMIKDGWAFGDKMYRIGHPFEWVCGDQHNMLYEFNDILALTQFISSYYEMYDTPAEMKCKNFEDVLVNIENILRNACKHFIPFVDIQSMENYIKSTALIRTQDYSFITTSCPDLPSNNVHHADLGPGLGSHATYSIHHLGAFYHGVEAVPYSYSTQRNFFRYLSPAPGSYLDLVECENFGILADEEQSQLIRRQDFRIRHLPSWKFGLIADKSIDLVTATWMLNELSTSGILWLLSNTMRTLKEGGYFYIRDSRLLKPLRHQIMYDNVLKDYGFECVRQLNVRNRVDYYGVPRCYRKTSAASPSFDELHNRYMGKFAITIHGGDYNQHINKNPA